VPVFTPSRVRSGLDGQPGGGTIGSAFRPGHFDDFSATIVEGSEDVAPLARVDGSVLAAHPASSELVGERLPLGSGLVDAFHSSSMGVSVQRLHVLGAQRLLAFRRL
jgi:hypothetical protein